MTSAFGTKGNGLALKNLKPVKQLLEYKIAAGIQMFLAYVRLLQVARWFHWPPLVCSKISFTRFRRRANCSLSYSLHIDGIICTHTVTVNAR